MARTKEELAKLLEDFKSWYEKDFEHRYSIENLKPVMEQALEERIKKFVYRRIGHLPDADFILFIELFLQEPKPVAVIEIPKEAIEASKLEPEEFVKTHGSKKKKT